MLLCSTVVNFVFSKKAAQIDEIFTVDLTICQINGEDFVNFCGLLRKHELYIISRVPYIEYRSQFSPDPIFQKIKDRKY